MKIMLKSYENGEKKKSKKVKPQLIRNAEECLLGEARG